MTNGVIDIQLLLYQIGTSIAALFVGFLAYNGLFRLIDERKEARRQNIAKEIDFYKQKIELLEIKHKYKTLEKEIIESEKEPSGWWEEDDSVECTCCQDCEQTEEVDIPTLDELIAEKGEDFLQHSDQPIDDSSTNKKEETPLFLTEDESSCRPYLYPHTGVTDPQPKTTHDEPIEDPNVGQTVPISIDTLKEIDIPKNPIRKPSFFRLFRRNRE